MSTAQILIEMERLGLQMQFVAPDGLLVWPETAITKPLEIAIKESKHFLLPTVDPEQAESMHQARKACARLIAARPGISRVDIQLALLSDVNPVVVVAALATMEQQRFVVCVVENGQACYRRREAQDATQEEIRKAA